ncbi:tetratricopeptide repeat protein [Lysobacter auxotrophicus]|uniref:Tetratricopeptide repeat protein n=1 Tax=Lysobacter auxotrophicus TaxID=2992573 RepID=A0ABN6UKW7_9GAMM|nr:tetratricopeptide repeat protein [Lysobacter auxotrophicus]BDU16812.1 tetratricopeptide repeat protein [Lysobacter auxotrophicus]
MRSMVVALFLAFACQAGLAQPATVGSVPVAGDDYEIAPASEVMALPASLRERVQREILHDNPGPHERLERLGVFLFSPDGLGMTYVETANLTVAQAYEARSANCLSFTMLFLALAKETGLDAAPQEIEQILGFRQADGTLYLSNHVNAIVRMGVRRYTVDVAGDQIIPRDPPQPITIERLIAHYYNNLAVDRLAAADYPAALALLERALVLDPGYAGYWSNAGVVRTRNGDPRGGERDYRHALELEPDNTNALFNLAGLAARMGDRPLEAQYRKRLARIQRNDPFHAFVQAVNAENAGDLARATRFYRRAIELQPQEHRFHSALANAYLKAGKTSLAIRSLARAQALSNGDTRAAYSERLDALRAR